MARRQRSLPGRTAGSYEALIGARKGLKNCAGRSFAFAIAGARGSATRAEFDRAFAVGGAVEEAVVRRSNHQG